MTFVDSNGIIRVEDTDAVSPLHPVFNSLAQSVTDRFDIDIHIHRVSNTSQRNNLVTTPLPTTSRPLFAWRSNAAAGRQLEYTTNGVDWAHYPSSEAEDDTGWVDFPSSGFESGFSTGTSGFFKGRRSGLWVVVTGYISGSFTDGNVTFFKTGRIPAAFRPESNQFGAAYMTGGYSGTAFVRPDGSAAVAQKSGSTRSTTQFTILYPRD